MRYELNCDCGHLLQVFASNCGEQAICPRCDKTILVPLLSELRRRAGAETVDVATKLRLMKLDKLLPLEDRCVECGVATESELYCQIECERMYAKKPGMRGFLEYAFATLFFMISFWFRWILVKVREDYLNPELEGSDLAVDAPIRLCEKCFCAKKMPHARRIALLRKTVNYGRLLDLYPDTGISSAKKLS